MSSNEQLQNEAPVVAFVNQLLARAKTLGASDIHLEPQERDLRLRLRIDGLLRVIDPPSAGIAQRMPARIKVMAGMDISERRLPQDGRLRLTDSSGVTSELRISTLPTLWGEKIVMRMLSNSSRQPGINDLGFEPAQQDLFLHALAQPQGLILVTGPTGSGKTVTMYSGLTHLNKVHRNISTAEDPVEMHLEGINQVGINPRIGLGFATTLRALLRQDPDVIMVGEIRDLETASIAMHASHTGHLVLSTLHINSAAATLHRLQQMGLAAHDLATSISLIIAQRLMRKLCLRCRRRDPNTDRYLRDNWGTSLLIDQVFAPSIDGCNACYRGYHGRTGIFELLSVDENALARNNDRPAKASDQSNASSQLRMTAMKLVAQGVTSLQEANRVTVYQPLNLPQQTHKQR